MSISTILPPATVKPTTASGRPRGATTSPAAPLTSAGRANAGEPRDRAAPARPRPRAPRISRSARRAQRRRGRPGARRPGRAPPAARRSRRRGRPPGRPRPARAGGPGPRRAPAPPLHPAAGAAGELPRGGRRAPDDGRDLVERHGEHVVQHEREPLGRGSASRAPPAARDRPSRPAAPRARGRVRPRGSRSARARGRPSGSSRRDLRERSMSRRTRATTVVSQPPRFSTLAGVGAVEPEPGLLDGVVGLAERAEHPVGHRAPGACGPPRIVLPGVRARPLSHPFVRGPSLDSTDPTETM